MLKRVLRLIGVTLTLVAILISASSTATATNTGFSTLNVNGEAVKIYRDDFGIPHIFAETNRGLFAGISEGGVSENVLEECRDK